MNQIEGLKTTLQSLCNISAEDATVPAEILSKVLGVCSENKALRSTVDNLKELSKDLISRLENASRESERLNLLEQQIKDLSDKNNGLKDQLNKKDKSIEDLQKQVSDKDLQIRDLSDEMSRKNSELNILNQDCDELEMIRKKYDNLDIRPYYEKLSDNLKNNSLSDVFVKTDTISLLSSGIQENNIMRLYNLLEDRVREGIWDNYEELNEIVNRLFDLYNQGRKVPFVIINPDIDSVYNDDEHRTTGRDSYGSISKVLLFGYKTAKGEIKKKAFVEVH